jgi:hypothetical protein
MPGADQPPEPIGWRPRDSKTEWILGLGHTKVTLKLTPYRKPLLQLDAVLRKRRTVDRPADSAEPARPALRAIAPDFGNTIGRVGSRKPRPGQSAKPSLKPQNISTIMVRSVMAFRSYRGAIPCESELRASANEDLDSRGHSTGMEWMGS